MKNGFLAITEGLLITAKHDGSCIQGKIVFDALSIKLL